MPKLEYLCKDCGQLKKVDCWECQNCGSENILEFTRDSSGSPIFTGGSEE